MIHDCLNAAGIVVLGCAGFVVIFFLVYILAYSAGRAFSRGKASLAGKHSIRGLRDEEK